MKIKCVFFLHKSAKEKYQYINHSIFGKMTSNWELFLAKVLAYTSAGDGVFSSSVSCATEPDGGLSSLSSLHCWSQTLDFKMKDIFMRRSLEATWQINVTAAIRELWVVASGQHTPLPTNGQPTFPSLFQLASPLLVGRPTRWSLLFIFPNPDNREI